MPIWLSKIGIKLAALGAIILAIFIAIFAIFKKGEDSQKSKDASAEKAAELKQTQAVLQQTQHVTEIAREIDAESKQLPPSVPSQTAAQAPAGTDPTPPTVQDLPEPVAIKNADPNSAAGRLDILARGGLVVMMGIAGTLVGCQEAKTLPVATNPCDGWQFIMPSRQDHLTDDTARQIWAHDCQGYRLKCWTPPGIEEACKAPGAKP